MMKDRKNLPQMILLGVLVAVCAGFVVTKVTGKKTAPPAQSVQAPAREARQLQPNDGTSSAPETSPPGPTVTAVQAVVPPAPATRDPFSPAMDVSTRLAAGPPRGIGGQVPPFIPPIGPIPPIGTGPTSTQAAGPSKPVEEPFPPFVLTGIITGRTNVAIIRLGEGRYVVREGQLISGTYEVVSVSQEGVLLSRDGRSVFLKLGGQGNAS
jgi:hypothetical protein